MSFLRFNKSKRFILSVASDYITKFEDEISRTGYYTVSCKQDILERISQEIDSYKSDLSDSKYSDDELRDIALRMVCTNSFELFEGHKYRVMGVVNMTGPARNALQVHAKAMDLAIEKGFCTPEDVEEDSLALQDVIKERY